MVPEPGPPPPSDPPPPSSALPPPTFRRPSARGPITVAILIVVGVVWIAVQGVRRRLAGPPRDAHASMQAVIDRMMASPEFKTWVTTHPDIQRDATRAMHRGLRRLDDESLKRRLTLLTKIAAVGDTHRCAEVERGKVSQDNVMATLEGLTPADRDQFNDIIFRAAEADIKGTPRPRWVSRQRRDAFYRELTARLSQLPNGERLLAAQRNVAGASDDDLCAAMRATYQAVDAMPDALRSTAALVLVGERGGHALFEHPRWLSLPDGALVMRARILEALLAKADLIQCAELAREAAPQGDVEGALQQIPEELQDAWRLMARQLDRTKDPPVAIDGDGFNRYSDAVLRRLERDRFDPAAFNNPDAATPADACRAHRQLVSAVLRLPKPLRAIGARVLAGGAPPETDVLPDDSAP